MATKHTPAPEVGGLARDVIAKHHRHLANTRIEYAFVDPTPKSAGKEKWGTARLISSLNAFLAADEDDREEAEEQDEATPPFFAIVIAKPVWLALTAAQREALVDHELSHCSLDDTGKLTLLGHDLEEFAAVVARHGFWRDDVKQFMETAGQGRLGLDELDTVTVSVAGHESVTMTGEQFARLPDQIHGGPPASPTTH